MDSLRMPKQTFSSDKPSLNEDLEQMTTWSQESPTGGDPSYNSGTNGTGTTQDNENMQRMGKKQEFRRDFRQISTIGFTSCVMGTWEILLTASGPGLVNGGLPGLFWSLCWTYVGMFFVILSLAEMSSMAPTAGGQYHWVSEFAPARAQRLLSYYTGWLSSIAWQSVVATDCFILAGVVQELISVNVHDYNVVPWQGSLLTIAMAWIMAAFNIFAARHLPVAEGVFATCHIFCFVPVVLALWILSPEIPSADVFLHFKDSGGGWSSTALSVLVGQLPCMFTTLGSDSVAHLAEEVQDAAINVPHAMVWSYVFNAPLALLLMVVFLFSINDIDAAMQSTYPFVPVFQSVFDSSKATTAFTIVILLLLSMITVSALASTSRQFFAFARDNGMPYASYWKRVSPRFKVPVNAIMFTAVYTSAMALINIGSAVAFLAVLSLSTVALMATYTISIGCILLKRLRNEPLPDASWSLGKAGFSINIVGFAYSGWCLFWSFWPPQHAIMAQNFNWAVVLFVALMGTSTLLFVFNRKAYHGPAVTVRGYLSTHRPEL